MRPKLSLLTTAAALAFGLTATAALAEDPKGDAPGAKSDITIVTDDTGNAAGAAGAEQGTPEAGDQGNANVPDESSQATIPGSPNATDEGAPGATGGAEDQGAVGKSTEGATSAQPPVKEGKIPAPSSSY